MKNLNYINLGKNLLIINNKIMRIYNNCVYGRSHAGMLECMPPHVYEEQIKIIDKNLNNYIIKLNNLGMHGADMRGHGSAYVNSVHMCSHTCMLARIELKKYAKYYLKNHK